MSVKSVRLEVEWAMFSHSCFELQITHYERKRERQREPPFISSLYSFLVLSPINYSGPCSGFLLILMCGSPPALFVKLYSYQQS